MGSFEEESERQDTARRREPTEEERAAFEEMLLDEDIEGAIVRAKAYAMKLTRRNETMARQMAEDAFRLAWERCTWDREKVSLGRYLVGVVRSEFSNAARDGAAEREEAEEYMTELETLSGPTAPSPESANIDRGERTVSEAEAAREIDEVRRILDERGDTVGLLALSYMLDDVFEPADMARLSGRPVEDFYRAADRRSRLVDKLRRRRQRDEE